MYTFNEKIEEKELHLLLIHFCCIIEMRKLSFKNLKSFIMLKEKS